MMILTLRLILELKTWWMFCERRPYYLLILELDPFDGAQPPHRAEKKALPLKLDCRKGDRHLLIRYWGLFSLIGIKGFSK